MSFKDINVNTEYRSGSNNVIKDFYIPVLSQAVKYKRAVGFFSSSALIQIAKGISGLVANGGKIELIVSPKLSDEDIQAINKGYQAREEVISNAIISAFEEPKNYFESERLNMLATLIAENKLDIKVAFTLSSNQLGIYHEKMGLIYDHDNNIIAFSGSINESENAFIQNYEVMDVFCSWQSDFESKKVLQKETAFHLLWTNADSKVTIIDFPDLAVKKLLKYKKEKIDVDIDKKELQIIQQTKKEQEKNVFRVPPYISFDDHPYQLEAINNWMNNNSKGIFDMATGSGKTYTALGAISALSKKLNDQIGVIILCPLQNLVEQWVEDINKFNVQPLICYSKYDWKKKFKFLINDFNLGIKKNFCIVMANASFSTDFVQERLKKLKGNVCIVVDEAHNFGAKNLRGCMLENFPYRLALSATLERHHDEEGTAALLNYFDKKCIVFSLKDAINQGFLTPYYYHPVVISLCEDELAEYNELTEKIKKILKNSKNDELPEIAETLLIKRSRIISGARNKIQALRELMQDYKNDNNILVYCGATKAFDSCDDESDIRQIEKVVDIMGNELGMRVSMFTSKESPQERERIKKSFAEGDLLQALVAIKCLDEGINIPGIKTAFILASSTNPKEYIQRRGRVLRKSNKKHFAKIYDFITLPHNLDSNEKITNLNSEISLFKREKERLDDFIELCENPSESVRLVEKIEEYYNLNYIGGNDYGF